MDPVYTLALRRSARVGRHHCSGLASNRGNAPEAYPARIRARGAGAASAVTRLASVLGPVVIARSLTVAAERSANSRRSNHLLDWRMIQLLNFCSLSYSFASFEFEEVGLAWEYFKNGAGMKAYLIVLDNDQNVMIGRGGACAGLQRQGWHLPGGTINEDESKSAAALRECEEETGYPIDTLPTALFSGPVEHVAYYDQHNANRDRFFF
jgi:hypothetical protein